MFILNRFFGDQRGNTTILFSLAFVGLLGIADLAIDYSRATAARARIAAAADTSVLAGAKDGATLAERKALAQQYFNAAIANIPGTSNVNLIPEDVVSRGKVVGFKVSGTVRLETMFGSLYGTPHFDVGFLAQSIRDVRKKLELALVLDTTYSMSAGGKITTLKAAAKDLVQQLKQNAISQDQVRIAVVPFAQYVNVGLSRRNEPWISVSADWTETIPRSCYTRTPVTSATNCVTTTHTGQSCNDGVCTPRTYTRRTCDYTYGAPQQVCVGPRTVNHVWRGCVGSRGAPRYKTDDNYNVEKVPGLLDTSCSTEMLPLSGNQGQIISKINALSPSGETYVPSGLIWGWRALSPGAPFSESALGGAEPVEQALVLMTDGFNTKSRNGSKHNGSNTNDANTTTSDICTNIKAVSSGIKVYTIAYSVTDPAIKAILQSCASKPEYYFDAGSNAQLTAAFEQIARSLTQIRLTR